LVEKIRKVIELVEKDWCVVVVAVTGDASGESLRARKDLVIAIPQLLAPDCYSHQVSF
jgi:hypothetical protein